MTILFHKNSAFISFVAFLLVEQALVGSSTLWIAHLSAAGADGRPLGLYLLLFICSLTLVYVPSSLKHYFLNAAKFSAHRSFVMRFFTNYLGRATLCRSEKLKTDRQPYLTSDSWQIVDESLDFIGFFLGLVLNVVINVTAFASTIHRSFALAYLISFPLVIASAVLSSRLIARRSRAAQDARIEYSYTLMSGWDSILLGNTHNSKLWRDRFLNRFRLYRHAHLRNLTSIEVVTDLSMILSLVPILGTLCWQITSSQGEVALLTVLIATLPRQIQTIQNMSDIALHLMRWNSLAARLESLSRSLAPPLDAESYRGRIDSDAIRTTTRFADKSTDTTPIFQPAAGFNREALSRPGRITVRGPNGSGKSTLLYQLKEILGTDATLLPTHSDQAFQCTLGRTFSSGQKLKAVLAEIQSDDRTPILLLDEWDANLDHEAMLEISRQLDQLAETRCLVEVRHRVEG